jgi:hypothetical protein
MLTAACAVRAADGVLNGHAFADRLQPAPESSGFRMAGYWLWDGSVIKVGDTYHLFASRWPKGHPFPEDYRRHSQIVRATSRDPLGPYVFQEVVLSGRGGSYWDGQIAPNPTIHKIGDTYVLYYIGSDDHTLQPGGKLPLRRISYATATAITGPWVRLDQPIVQEDSNNPAVCVEPDGGVKLLYRTADLRVKIAAAPSFRGPYAVVNDNVWPATRLEDFDFFKVQGKYYIICEDNVGGVTGHDRWGALLVSSDGITGWKPVDRTPAYDHAVRFADGSVLQCSRRERPQLMTEDGEIKALWTSVFDGRDTWCQPVPVLPPLRLD